jgi:hypothetical protein
MTVHYTNKVGVYSELIAKSALIAAGWDAISEPYTNEYFDISARHPETGKFNAFQVKTIHRRDNFRGHDWLVLYTTNGNGKHYDVENASDYYIGVLVDNGAVPRVFLVENTAPAKTEWWSKAGETEAKGWHEIPIALDRLTLGA